MARPAQRHLLVPVEPPPTKLARGPTKPDDIERLRRDLSRVRPRRPSKGRVFRAARTLAELEEACETIREDVDVLRRAVAGSL